MRTPFASTTSFGSTPQPFAAAPQTTTDIPFNARPLIRKEQRRRDLYLYRSPKLKRTVEVIGALSLTVALELEFSPSTVAFVERPRLLRYGGAEVELDFWQRERSGRERFHLLVSDDALEIEPISRRRRHRSARELVEAANAAGISLEFVLEADLVARAAALGTWYRLLPYVQTAYSLPHRITIEERVLEAFSAQSRMTFMQMEATLRGLHPADVRAVVCALIHRGTLSIDAMKPLHLHTVVEVGGEA